MTTATIDGMQQREPQTVFVVVSILKIAEKVTFASWEARCVDNTQLLRKGIISVRMTS